MALQLLMLFVYSADAQFRVTCAIRERCAGRLGCLPMAPPPAKKRRGANGAAVEQAEASKPARGFNDIENALHFAPDVADQVCRPSERPWVQLMQACMHAASQRVCFHWMVCPSHSARWPACGKVMVRLLHCLLVITRPM